MIRLDEYDNPGLTMLPLTWWNTLLSAQRLSGVQGDLIWNSFIHYFLNFRRFRNDFYPFIHSELAVFDPVGYQMVGKAFHCNRDSSSILSPPDYHPDTYHLDMLASNIITPLAGYTVFSPLVTPTIFIMASTTMGMSNTLSASMFLLQVCRLYCWESLQTL